MFKPGINNYSDPFDKLIQEDGIRIVSLMIDNKVDLLILVLNNGKIVKGKISDFPSLYNASPKQLNRWKLIEDGMGVKWHLLNENLSVKTLIKTAIINAAAREIQENNRQIVV